MVSLTQFPEHHITEANKPFWNSRRRYPKAIQLDVENEMHLSLIHSSSNLYAQMLDIPQEHDKSVFKSMLLTIKPKKVESRGEIRHYDEEK